MEALRSFFPMKMFHQLEGDRNFSFIQSVESPLHPLFMMLLAFEINYIYFALDSFAFEYLHLTNITITMSQVNYF